MTTLLFGLVLFLGIHSIRIFSEASRSNLVARLGVNGYKGAYTLISLLGLGLMIWGYGQTRLDPVDLWYPPLGMRHATTTFTLVAFILFAAASPAASHIKAWVRHPMTVGVKAWAFGHLLANGRLGDVVLFGAFMVWAMLVYRAARQRDRAGEESELVVKGWGADAKAIIGGSVVWAVFAFALHGWLIGVRPFG